MNHIVGLTYQFAWQAEYGVVSFGGKQLDRVVRYVLNQRRHHEERTTLPFLERDTEEKPGARPEAADAERGENA